MTGFYIFSNPMTDEWWQGIAVNQGHKLILIVFGKIFIFHLQENKIFPLIFTILSLNQMDTNGCSKQNMPPVTCRPCTDAR